MRDLIGESFDRFARYSHLWSLRRASVGEAPITILDVGDPYGMGGRLFPADHTVSLDLFMDTTCSRDGHVHVLGSGLRLPFREGSFDLVATHDAYEHVPEQSRREFVKELLRVGRGPVLLVAPFADPRTVACERIVNSYYVARIGHSLAPLDEHAACGLPDLTELAGWLQEEGVEHVVHGDGWLYHWLAFMLVKGHLVSEGCRDLEVQLDVAFNGLLRERDRRPPHYRRSIIMRPPGVRPDFPPLQQPDDVPGDAARLADLAWGLTLALPRGERLVEQASALRRWIADNLDGEQGDPKVEVARSLAIALDAVAAAVPEHPPYSAAQPPLLSARLPEPAGPASTEPAALSEPGGSSDFAPAAHPVLLLRLTVAVVIVNLDGEDYLRTCLDSLAKQSYPSELTQVIVVDNGSQDKSLELLAVEYPWVSVLAQGRNLGFAPAVAVGVQAATDAECVALLNNDMRVDPDWLLELVKAYDPANGVVCVGAQILDWSGEHLDFGDGSINFHGMGGQIGFGQPADAVHLVDGEDLLFACGGAMLVSRAVYLDSGGFDPKFFAYFEDTDFGWRLRLLGFRTVLAKEARCYHRHHGTSSRFAEHERLLLYERNALRSVIKNFEDDNLKAVLGPALLLLMKRAVLRGELDRSEFDIGRGLPKDASVSRNVLAHVLAVSDLVDDLGDLLQQRRSIQAARKVSDAEVVERFGHPLLPVHPDPGYLLAQHRLVTGFGLHETFDRGRARRVLVVSADEVGEKMRGPAIRAWEIARALAGSAPVIVAVPAPTDKTAEGVGTVVYDSETTLHSLARHCDVIIVQGYMLRRNPILAETNGVLVVDLYDPWLFENLEIHGAAPHADRALRQDVSVLNELVDKGDFFVCASERQRDYWLGMLSARGRVDSGAYARDPSLRDLIDVVPFGLEDRPPRHAQPVLKGVHPGVGSEDLVVLWGGGTWDWFDPIMVVEAFAKVVDRVPRAKLFFLGLQLPGPNVADMKMAERVVQRSEELGLAGDSVLFGDWTPYELRESYLLEADVAVSAGRDIAETRLSFRSRLLDYFWAGLPVVTTSGDVLSDLVKEKGLGRVVAPGDVEGMAAALESLLANPVLRSQCATRAGEVAKGYTWRECVAPLRRATEAPWRWRVMRELRGRVPPITEDVHALFEDRSREIDVRERLLEEQRRHIAELEAGLAHHARRLDQLRRTPAYPLFKLAQKALRRARGVAGQSGLQ